MTPAGVLVLMAAAIGAAGLVGFGWTIGATIAAETWAWLTAPEQEPDPERCDATTIYQPSMYTEAGEIQCEEIAGHEGSHLYTAAQGPVTWSDR